MIPNTDPRVVAIIEQGGRQLSVSVLAWDDRHRALVASTRGQLTAAEDLNGFTRLAQLTPESSEDPVAGRGDGTTRTGEFRRAYPLRIRFRGCRHSNRRGPAGQPKWH